MKRYILLLLLVAVVIMSLTAQVGADARFQKYYYYWVTGYVADAADKSGVKAEDHQVIFYKDSESYNDKKAFARVGTTGITGQANRFMVNAFAYPDTIKVGEKYLVAIVRDENGYGADPVEVTISGRGYETMPTFTLEFGKGPLAVMEDPPKIAEIWFGKRKYQKDLAEKDPEYQFIVAKNPKIKVTVTSSSNINPEGLSIVLNEGTPDTKTYNVQTSHIKAKSFADSGALRELTYEYQVAAGDDSLNDEGEGLNVLEFKAANVSGVVTSESVKVTVLGGPLRIIGTPIVYPSPFSHIRNPGGLDIQYILSKDAEIDLFITGADGVVVKRMTCYAGQSSVWGGEGGAAGLNKVHWDGVSDFGYKVGNAIYVVTIVSREENKVLGDVLLTVVN